MPSRNRLQAALAIAGRHDRPLFLLASLGVNLPLFWALANVPRGGPVTASPVIIPVAMVEEVPRPERPDPIETEAPEEPPAPPSEPPPPPTMEADTEVPPAEAPTIQSPIEAPPGERADAVMPERASEVPARQSLPALSGEHEQGKAVEALSQFRCARLGRERPAGCDEPVETVSMPTSSQDLAPARWADFGAPTVDPEIRRIWADDCAPKQGVIDDAFTQDTTYYRQGAHAGVGSLSKNSTNKRCP